MAVQLIANCVEDSGLTEEFDNGLWVQSAMRTDKVTGLDEVATAATLLRYALQTYGIPPRFQPYDNAYPNCICLSRQVLPIRESDNSATIKIGYQVNPAASQSGGLGFYIYTDTTTDVTVECECLPGMVNALPGQQAALAQAGTPFEVNWTIPAANAGPGTKASYGANLLGDKLPAQTVNAAVLMPLRRVVLRGYQNVNAAQKMRALRNFSCWSNLGNYGGRRMGSGCSTASRI